MKNNSMINFLGKHYKKRMKKALKRKGYKEADVLVNQYQKRFLAYMEKADFGEKNEKFSSYLNIFSGLAAYELLRKNGFTQAEGIAIYDYMCKPLRIVAAWVYRIADIFPKGYTITVNSLKEDLVSEKAVCWETEVLCDDKSRFEYRITKCLYFDTCKAHGYPEFTKVFCDHDRYAYDVLHKHVKFVRHSAIGEGGDCCHDAFVAVGQK